MIKEARIDSMNYMKKFKYKQFKTNILTLYIISCPSNTLKI